MYGLKYDDDPEFSRYTTFHVDVFRVAERFDIPQLLNLAFENIKEYFEEAWDADYFLELFEMMNSHDHDYCMSICRKHIDELLTEPEFDEILRSDTYSELARELTKMLGKSLRSYCCPHCKQIWSLDCSLSSPSYCPTCGHHEQNWDKFWK